MALERGTLSNQESCEGTRNLNLEFILHSSTALVQDCLNTEEFCRILKIHFLKSITVKAFALATILRTLFPCKHRTHGNFELPLSTLPSRPFLHIWPQSGLSLLSIFHNIFLQTLPIRQCRSTFSASLLFCLSRRHPPGTRPQRKG